LLGKVLGPIGMVLSFDDDWPRRLGMICVYNDLIWWLPFGLFLVRGTALADRLVRAAPWLCAVLHFAAIAFTAIFLRGGMLTEPKESIRAAYIADNAIAWSTGWLLWMIAAMSLVGFYAWWGSTLRLGPAFQPGKPDLRSSIATVAVLIAAFGTVFDFSGEGLSILVLVERAASALAMEGELSSSWDPAAFISAERSFTLLSAGVANLLYTFGGILLTVITTELPEWVRTFMWMTWMAGIATTVAGVMNHVAGLVVSTAVLFPLFIIWTVWMAARWRRS
jgi:hypothetical protein